MFLFRMLCYAIVGGVLGYLISTVEGERKLLPIREEIAFLQGVTARAHVAICEHEGISLDKKAWDDLVWQIRQDQTRLQTLWQVSCPEKLAYLHGQKKD